VSKLTLRRGFDQFFLEFCRSRFDFFEFRGVGCGFSVDSTCTSAGKLEFWLADECLNFPKSIIHRFHKFTNFPVIFFQSLLENLWFARKNGKKFDKNIFLI